MRRALLIIASSVGAALAAFLLWYGGTSTAMSKSEVNQRLQHIRASVIAKGKQPDEHMLSALRELASSDDGREFFMVNLIKYRDKALYPAELIDKYGDDARAADQRYSRAIAPFLLKNGNFPVYVSEVQGRFLDADGATDWDRVAIVRYRSRRDLFKMVEQIAAADLNVAVHKWASIQRTEVFPTDPVIRPLQVRLLAFVVLFALGGGLYGMLRVSGALRPGRGR